MIVEALVFQAEFYFNNISFCFRYKKEMPVSLLICILFTFQGSLFLKAGEYMSTQGRLIMTRASILIRWNLIPGDGWFVFIINSVFVQY